MSVHSSFNKAFPTTMSLIVTEENGADSLKCEFIWAGDSRGYFLDQGGLCQITVDDINANVDDAFQNLIDDGIMTNMVNGEKEFKLHYRVLELKRWRNLPAMLISATDGAFLYFQTSMEFEFLILDTLNSAKTPAEWKAMLKSRLDEIAGDDYVLAIGLFGFENFKAVGKHFSNRYSDIKGIMNQIDAIDPKQPDRIEQLRKIWNTYKSAYYRENGEK